MSDSVDYTGKSPSMDVNNRVTSQRLQDLYHIGFPDGNTAHGWLAYLTMQENS